MTTFSGTFQTYTSNVSWMIKVNFRDFLIAGKANRERGSDKNSDGVPILVESMLELGSRSKIKAGIDSKAAREQ